jgi:hypothetical protein
MKFLEAISGWIKVNRKAAKARGYFTQRRTCPAENRKEEKPLVAGRFPVR